MLSLRTVHDNIYGMYRTLYIILIASKLNFTVTCLLGCIDNKKNYLTIEMAYNVKVSVYEHIITEGQITTNSKFS